MTTITLPHLPSHSVHAFLFEDVQNCAFLRQQLLDGNADFEYAFLDASTMTSTTHVLAAVFRAVNDMLHSRLKSRNVHSEIVFSFSPNNNIADSFRRFGISDTTRSLLAIKVANVTTPSSAPAPAFSAVQSHLRASVDGTPMPFTDESLRRTTDMAKVRKLYKLDSGGEAKKGAAEKTRTNGTADGIGDVDERREVEAVALGMMALKGS